MRMSERSHMEINEKILKSPSIEVVRVRRRLNYFFRKKTGRPVYHQVTIIPAER